MKYLILAMILLCHISMTGQKNEEPGNLPKGNYLGISGGFSTGIMRDELTSPLFYTGLLSAIAIDYNSYFGKNILNANFTTLNGLYIKSTHDDFLTGTGNIFDLDLTYYRLLPDNSDAVIKNYLGFSAGNSSMFLINNAFMNAGFTFDNITDFGLNLKSDWSITRAEKQKKFLWLIKYTSKEKRYLLSGKLGVPIYSIIYRPGYTNPGNSTVNNDQLLPGYKTKGKVFSGINTDISVARVLKNGNMYKFSFYWDFMTTGQTTINKLDMSKHTFLFSLIFKIN